MAEEIKRSAAKHIVALSGGWDSTALALRLAEVEPRDYIYLCTPTGRELPPMAEHWAKLERLLGRPIEKVSAKTSFAGLVYIQKALPSWRMRWCTRLLKIKPFEEYIAANLPCTVYVGLRADEVEDREGVAWEEIGGVTRRYPFVEWGWGVKQVVGYVKCHDAVPPERTDCDNCFFQTLHEWYLLWLNYPDRWAESEAWEEYTGHTLRSPGRDTWPAALKDLASRFKAGDIPKQRTTMKDRKVMCSTCAR